MSETCLNSSFVAVSSLTLPVSQSMESEIFSLLLDLLTLNMYKYDSQSSHEFLI